LPRSPGHHRLIGEYSLLEQVDNLPASLDVVAALYPQLQNIDFRTQALHLNVPVYLVQGRHELPGRASLAQEWFQQLKAPKKQMILFDTAWPSEPVRAARPVQPGHDHDRAPTDIGRWPWQEPASAPRF
jgi:hypothetical protein